MFNHFFFRIANPIQITIRVSKWIANPNPITIQLIMELSYTKKKNWIENPNPKSDFEYGLSITIQSSNTLSTGGHRGFCSWKVPHITKPRITRVHYLHGKKVLFLSQNVRKSENNRFVKTSHSGRKRIMHYSCFFYLVSLFL